MWGSSQQIAKGITEAVDWMKSTQALEEELEFRAHTALVESMTSVPSMHVKHLSTTSNSSFQEFNALFCGAFIHRQKTSI